MHNYNSASGEMTTENITAAGLDNVTVTPLSNGKEKKYEISGNVEKNTEEIKLTVGLDTYFQEMTVDSSTSLAVTSASLPKAGTRRQNGLTATAVCWHPIRQVLFRRQQELIRIQTGMFYM